ncbi:hypothetical protein D3C80_1968260 [compost metagenome]
MYSSRHLRIATRMRGLSNAAMLVLPKWAWMRSSHGVQFWRVFAEISLRQWSLPRHAAQRDASLVESRVRRPAVSSASSAMNSGLPGAL